MQTSPSIASVSGRNPFSPTKVMETPFQKMGLPTMIMRFLLLGMVIISIVFILFLVAFLFLAYICLEASCKVMYLVGNLKRRRIIRWLVLNISD